MVISIVICCVSDGYNPDLLLSYGTTE